MKNKPRITVCQYILVDNASTVFIIERHTSNLQKCFKVHYIIESTDEYNVFEDKYRPLLIIEGTSSRHRISTTIRIPLSSLNSNTSHTPSPQPPIQPSPTKSQFRMLQSIIENCRTRKFDKVIPFNHPLYIC